MSPHGKHKKRRIGAHKSRYSPDTKVWEAEHLLPEKPGWMAEGTYRRLAELRAEL